MTTVRIIGNGIARAALTAALDRPDWSVVVHERDPESRALDTVYALFPTAMTALRAAGLGAVVEASGLRVESAQIRSAEGRVLARIPRLGTVMIGRAQFHDILTAARQASTTLVPGEVISPQALGADVLVGADGARSTVRREVWGLRSAPRTPALTVIRGVIDEDLSGGGVTEHWGERMLLGITPVPGRPALGAADIPASATRTTWFAAFPEHRFATTAEGLEDLRIAARTFPAPVAEILEAATEEQTVISGIHVARPLTSFVSDNTVLIGDAAHAMQPNLGRGACESIIDAVVLAGLLNAHEPQRALALHSRRRRVLPQVIRSAASVASAVALAGGRAARARDRVLTAMARLPGP